MRIVHLIYSFNTGGSETMLVDIANEQVKQAEVSIVIINKIYNKQLVEKFDNRVKVYFIGREESSKNPYPIVKLNILLLKIGSNVLHCHNHNIVPLLIPFLRKNAVLTLHDVGIEIKHFKLYSKLFAISDIVKDDIKNRADLKAIRIYNGIHPEKIQAMQDYTTTEIFRIIQVSRLNHLKKGQHIAIEALKILKKNGFDNIKLDFIGEGESDQYLKKLVSDFKLEDQIQFLSNRTRDYIYSKLKDYELLIQPSIYEGFGLTVAEGMAAKIPVLVSNIDGPMEVIDDGKYGYYFESGNPQSLADQLNFIISNYNSEDMKQKIESAYIRVKNCFDIKETARKYIEEYQKN